MNGSGIHIKPSHKGLLHRKLGIPEGQPIPEARIAAAEHSSSPALRSEAQFADNARGFHHAGHPHHTPHPAMHPAMGGMGGEPDADEGPHPMLAALDHDGDDLDAIRRSAASGLHRARSTRFGGY